MKTSKKSICATCRHRVVNQMCVDGTIYCPVYDRFRLALKPHECADHQVLEV